jgi:hypothetical protein
MSDFDALALIGKHYGVLSDDIPCPDRRKTDRFAVSFAGDAFPTIDRAIL